MNSQLFISLFTVCIIYIQYTFLYAYCTHVTVYIDCLGDLVVVDFAQSLLDGHGSKSLILAGQFTMFHPNMKIPKTAE